MRFLIAILIVTGMLIAGLWLGYNQNWWSIPAYASESVVVLLLLTVILFFYLKNIQRKQPDIFVQFYLLSISLKLMAGLFFLGAIFWFDEEGKAGLGDALLFLFTYSLFTGIEVYFLLTKQTQ
jgi:hypothetical protein